VNGEDMGITNMLLADVQILTEKNEKLIKQLQWVQEKLGKEKVTVGIIDNVEYEVRMFLREIEVKDAH